MAKFNLLRIAGWLALVNGVDAVLGGMNAGFRIINLLGLEFAPWVQTILGIATVAFIWQKLK